MQTPQSQVLYIFAAASLTDALDEISNKFIANEIVKIKTSYGSSSTLARQIEQGAPADLFLSANPEWMNYLAERQLIIPESRQNLLGNTLVLIASKDSKINSITINSPLELNSYLPKGSYLAMGDPDHVPAGVYGKQALENLQAWEGIENKIARADSVRGALTQVARGEAPLGIVYHSDALVAKDIKILATFPQNSHAPIIYPIALIKNNQDKKTAQAFLNFLKSKEAAVIFEKYGFTMLR